MFKAILSTAICVLFSGKAFGGFMIEPYLGYDTGKAAVTTIGGSDLGGTSTAINAGARIGWGFMGFWTGLDYSLSTTGKVSLTTPVAGTEITYSKADLGLAFGYNFPIKFRTYLTYNLTPSMTSTSTTAGVGTDTKYTGGTSWKLGVGYGLIAWLTANLEYYSNAPAKLESAGTTVDVSTIYSKFTETGYRLVFSFPVSL